jgi:hypothetical protein
MMILERDFCRVGWAPAHQVNIEINIVFFKAHSFGGQEFTLQLLLIECWND